jgi:hypothetical protein
MLQHRLLEYFALVELSITMILSSVKYEHCFSTLSSLKFKLCIWLIKHLHLVVKMFTHDHYILDSSHFKDMP